MDTVRSGSQGDKLIYCSSPAAQYLAHRAEIQAAISRTLDSGSYILGHEVSSFERSFASYCKASFAVGVNSGTDALIIALKSLDIKHGDEVITASHTALATAAAIIAVGATPVLCDVEPENYTIDTKELEALISKKTKAIIPVHIYGHPAEMDAITGIASAHNIRVIEDCSQSTGGSFRGRRLGTIGDIGCFSFYPTKNLGAIGDGGLLITNHPEIASKISAIRQYGWDPERNTLAPGINSRLDEIQAAVLNVKLKYLDQDNLRRQTLAELYTRGLIGKVQKVPELKSTRDSVCHLYVIEVDQREKVINTLEASGIFPGIHYKRAVHQHNGYTQYCRLPRKGLPVTERIVKRILSLPMFPELSNSDVSRVVSQLQ